MNYEETKKIMKRYKDYFFRLNYINERMAGIKSVSYGEKRGTKYRDMNDLIEEKDDLIRKMDDIRSMIDSVQDYKQMLVLRYKFTDFKTLEEIADIMGYSLSQIKRLYRSGIESVVENIKDDT